MDYLRIDRIAATKLSRARRSGREKLGSKAIWSGSRILPTRGTVIDASSIKRADIVVRTNLSWAWASTERGEVLISAIGFPGNWELLTSQSRAFFNEPGNPRAYSGAEINSPSALLISCRNICTGRGGSPVSRSGLKAGRFARPE